MTPTFILSASGAIASVVGLGLISLLLGLRRPWSPSVFGLALIAAWAHMATQLYVAWLLFIPHDGLWRLAPLLLSASTVFAAVTAWAAASVLQWLEQSSAKSSRC